MLCHQYFDKHISCLPVGPKVNPKLRLSKASQKEWIHHSRPYDRMRRNNTSDFIIIL